MVIVSAAARVVVVISSNLIKCTFYGGICGFVRGRDVNCCCGGSSLAHHFHHYQHHTKTPQPAALSSSPHSIHLTMAILAMVMVVTLVGLLWWGW